MSAGNDRVLTVADLLARGVDGVKANCGFCGHGWSAMIGFLPDLTTLEKVGQLLSCPACGRADVDVEPDWPHANAVH